MRNSSYYLGLGILMLTACGGANTQEAHNEPEEKGAIDHLLAEAEKRSTVESPTEALPAVDYTSKAAKILLEDGRTMRIDYQIDKEGNISGWSSYYRKNGTSFTIPFFGKTYFDIFIGFQFFELHEYHNYKCCGHHFWSLGDSDQIQNGYFELGEKIIDYKSFEVVEFDKEANASFETPRTNPSLGKALFPCSFDKAKTAFEKNFGCTPTHYLLNDIDRNGTYEAFLKSGEEASKIAVLWMKGAEPQFISYDGKGGESTWLGARHSMVITRDEKNVKVFSWKKGVPTLSESVPTSQSEEVELYWRTYHEPYELGVWVKME
ncbi:MAG: hypothetical protein MJZ28_03995 [Paludibacteraceae bacterium]|nr:hypothetical protein [Paludibacteraceae bacterium]